MERQRLVHALVVVHVPRDAHALRLGERVAHRRAHAVGAYEEIGLKEPLGPRGAGAIGAGWREAECGAIAGEVDAGAADVVLDAYLRVLLGHLLEKDGLEPVALQHARHVRLLRSRGTGLLEDSLRRWRVWAESKPAAHARREPVDPLHAPELPEGILAAPIQAELVGTLPDAPRWVGGGGRRRQRVEDINALPAALGQHDRGKQARRPGAGDGGGPLDRRHCRHAHLARLARLGIGSAFSASRR